MKRFALVFCLLLLPAAAFADGDFRWELTPHASYHFGGNFSAETNAPFGANLELDNGLAYGITFDIPLSTNLQVELLLNTQDSDLFFDKGIFGPDIETISADITYVHLGLLAQFGRPEVTPYFVVSAGVTNIDPNLKGAGADEQFSVSLGAGVKLFFTPWLGMRLEARGFWTKLDNRICGDAQCTHYNNYLSQGQAIAGFIFAW